MENSENEEVEDNFENCESFLCAPEQFESEDSLNYNSLTNIKFSTVCSPSGPLSQETRKEYAKFLSTKANNNHHVVPIGVLIVLATVYLGMNNIQKCFATCSENQVLAELLLQPHTTEKDRNLNYAENLKRSQILERLLEYKDICKDLEVFTKDININNTYDEDVDNEVKEDDENLNRVAELISGSGGDSGSGSGDCAKPHSKKHKKSKYFIKLPTNGKNGFHKHNKSTKAKNLKTDKKNINANKKNSTAEPIIYLFALVFIYLLIKAASDINQHYKSQNKNDKRLRRCSLQSYAQTHRPDRRASKAPDLASKQKHQRLLATATRSLSIEKQQQPQQPQQYQHHRYLEDSPKRTTPSTPPAQNTLQKRTPTSNNWQLLRQHMTQSVDNSDIITKSQVSKPEFSSTKNRRCSVPVALNYQQRQIIHSFPLGVITNDALLGQRRTSITMPIDPLDSLGGTETKRRVRMINRH